MLRVIIYTANSGGSLQPLHIVFLAVHNALKRDLMKALRKLFRVLILAPLSMIIFAPVCFF